MDVLNHHRSLIDQDADRKRQPAQRHDVDGLIRAPQGHNCGKQREGDSNDDDGGAAPVTQEEEHYQTCEQRSKEPFPDQ